MVEERSWVAAEGSIRMMRDIEELKVCDPWNALSREILINLLFIGSNTTST